jgi:deoxycytidylate deaminase
MKNALEEIYSQRENFIIIGLTGRTGSGCSKAAEILTKNIEDLKTVEPYLSNIPSNEDRKKYIIDQYAKKHWKPFFNIQARDIIASFILECTPEEMDKFLKSNGVSIGIKGIEKEYKKFFEFNKCLDNMIIRNLEKVDENAVYDYLKDKLPTFTELLKRYIDENSNKAFLPIFQKIGDNIRKNGIALANDDIHVEHIYAIAHRINLLIKVIRKRNKRVRESSGGKYPKDYFVIDAFRNPFEVLFFQERYAAFYLLSVNTHDEDRVDRLRKRFDLSPSQISEIDEKEYPKDNPLKDFSNFISQNIAACIQRSDIHINNPGKFENQNFNVLINQIVKFVSLIQHPGLITPSKNEKLMQIAFTAKLNSGCLSRQVGAVVANNYGAIKAIGWNSSPDDQVPCLLRNIDLMLENKDMEAYSFYEQSDTRFRQKAKEYRESLPDKDVIDGLNVSYCFKDLQNKRDGKKNQVHNRALHAEENAFLQLIKYGSESIMDGFLFTTASPCDACSRKAYQLGISRIVYIDPYPGIAIDHVLKSGSRKFDLVLFTGAIGRAYQQLYTPIIQIKDEIEALIP